MRGNGNYKHIFLWVCIALFLFVAFISVASATIFVPDDCLKIQWAVDNASAGDTIIVRDGTYTENVDVNKSLTIALAQGPIVIEEFPICTDPAHQQRPDISGHMVVWMDDRNGNYDIYGYDLSTGTEFPICTAPSDQVGTAISGDIVVWQDRRNWDVSRFDIYGYDLSTATEFPICTNPGDEYRPTISGDIVVWTGFRSGYYDIWGYDHSTHSEFRITAPGDQEYIAISGDTVVWQDHRNDNWNIYGYNLSTDMEFPVCTASDDQWSPAISGDIVVWSDDRSGNRDIYGYDLSTDTEFSICTDPEWQSSPAISGDIVVWQDNRNGNWDIYGARLGLAQLKVCIDPGHSPTDSNPDKRVEYAINKAVADKLKPKLEAEGIAVYLTNPSDDITARAAYANNLKPDIFVSLHCNALQGFVSGTPIGTARGSEVWIYDDTDSREQAINEHGLAVRSLNGLSEEIGSEARQPVPKEKQSPWPHGIPILRGVTLCPAVLLEMEFFDYGGPVTYKGVTYQNMLELMSTDIWPEDAAQGIANGILKYFEERGLTFTVYSPVEIVVTDPDGLAISRQLNEIPGATYTETDIDGDGDLDAQIRIPNRKIGDYSITVIPEPDALPTDTYTLEVSVGDTTITLAEDVQISDIPSEPYVIESTETGIRVPPVPVPVFNTIGFLFLIGILIILATAVLRRKQP